MGIGAAIGGLAQGFAQGVKLKSDLQDAESRRGLQELQAKAAQQTIDAEAERAAARLEAANNIKGYASGSTDLGFIRNEDGSYDPNRPENLQRNYYLQEQSAARVALANGQNPTKALAEVRELRKQGFQEGVNQAAALYRLGDLAAADAALSKVYPMVRDGQTFLGSQADPNDPSKVALRYKVDKTGEEKTMVTSREDLATRLLPLAMNITDAANFNLNVQNQALRTREVDLKQEEAKNLQSWREVQERLQSRELDIKESSAKSLASYHAMMGQAALARANTDRDSVNLQKMTQALNNQLGSVTTLLGVDRNFDPNKASAADIADHKQKLSTANTAMYLINQGISGGKLTMDATRAIQLAQAADNVPFADIKRDGPGMFSTTINGVKVPVGMSESQYGALAKANGVKPEPQATNSPTASGIKTPGSAAPVSRLNDSMPVETQQAGSQLDAARSELSAAAAKVRSFGLSQRRADPQGYQSALAAYQSAQSRLADAEAKYQDAIPKGLRGASFAQ